MIMDPIDRHTLNSDFSGIAVSVLSGPVVWAEEVSVAAEHVEPVNTAEVGCVSIPTAALKRITVKITAKYKILFDMHLTKHGGCHGS
jgi:hypothetical protein